MILEVLEGQTKGGYFSDSIFDPSVNQCIVHAMDNCPYCGQIIFLWNILLTIIHNMDNYPWYGQLFIPFYHLSMPLTQNTLLRN